MLHVRVRPAGKPVATIESGKWAGPVPNPFDCMVDAAIPEVLHNPALLNQYPYEAWIARISPVAPLEQALAGLVTGEPAREGYCTRARNEDIHCTRLAV